MLTTLLYFLIFPGLLFATVTGGILSWFDRKVTAMVQFRKGPPLLQPFYDFLKLLLVKETILPAKGSAITFVIMPVIALIGATLACVFTLMPALNLSTGFTGDIIVIFYLLNIPALAFIIGALASGNPLASIGASREIKLIISYELTFILIVAAIILKSNMSISLNEIISSQSEHAFIGSISGILLFIAALFCLQAKLGLVPFDLAEAETEINHGSFVEYSGSAYALVIATKYIMLFTLPVFLCMLLLGGLHFNGINILYAILKIAGIVLLLTLIRNTNPRLKIDQAMRFFFIWLNLMVIVAIALTYWGW